MFPLSDSFAPAQKSLITASVLLLGLAAIFGALNVSEAKELRSTAADAAMRRENSEQYRLKKENELKVREIAIVAAQSKLTTRDSKTVAS